MSGTTERDLCRVVEPGKRKVLPSNPPCNRPHLLSAKGYHVIETDAPNRLTSTRHPIAECARSRFSILSPKHGRWGPGGGSLGGRQPERMNVERTGGNIGSLMGQRG